MQTLLKLRWSCRYVLEMPANLATPTYLADTAESIAASSDGSLSAKILEKEECEKMGMGLYLGVSECSAEPPKFIHLTYSPKGLRFIHIAVLCCSIQDTMKIFPAGTALHLQAHFCIMMHLGFTP